MDEWDHIPGNPPLLKLPVGYGREQMRGFVQDAMALLSPVCEAEGFELVHIEFQAESGGRVLRLYIDKPGGVTLDDCAEFSREVSDLLDVMIETPGAYRLEVSSPGIERPLSKLDDFERFKGQSAKIKTYEPINGQKNFKGILMGVADTLIHLRIADKSVCIPHQDIARARLASEG